jgi:hypothetical protein
VLVLVLVPVLDGSVQIGYMGATVTSGAASLESYWLARSITTSCKVPPFLILPTSALV